MRRPIFILAALAALALSLGLVAEHAVAPVQAQPGTGLAAINVPAGCTSVGVAFDGTDILYTCLGTAAIFKTDLAGTDLGSVATADASGSAIDLDAIAWDPTEGVAGVLWGGETNTNQPGAGAAECGIWSVDMATGLATPRFHFPNDGHPVAACGATFFDGITVDTVTNTLYISSDVHTFIHHVDKSGAPAANDNIPFETLTTGLCPAFAQTFGFVGCLNSGLAIGLDGTLFAGTASDGKIMALDPNTPAFISQFGTVTGRDEDLECGPLFTKADGSVVETILSRDLGARIDVLEAPAGTCVSPVVGFDEIACDSEAEIVCKKLRITDQDGDGIIEVGEPVDFFEVIEVQNPSPGAWTNTEVTDKWGAEIDVTSATPSKGTATLTTIGKSDKEFLGVKGGRTKIPGWVIGTLGTGESATLELESNTDLTPEGFQSYTRCSLHRFNSGAVLKFLDPAGQERVFKTGSIVVSVLTDNAQGDCDGDGFIDQLELDAGTDPHDPLDFPVEVDFLACRPTQDQFNPGFPNCDLQTGVATNDLVTTPPTGTLAVLEPDTVQHTATWESAPTTAPMTLLPGQVTLDLVMMNHAENLGSNDICWSKHIILPDGTEITVVKPHCFENPLPATPGVCSFGAQPPSAACIALAALVSETVTSEILVPTVIPAGSVKEISVFCPGASFLGVFFNDGLDVDGDGVDEFSKITEPAF